MRAEEMIKRLPYYTYNQNVLLDKYRKDCGGDYLIYQRVCAAENECDDFLGWPDADKEPLKGWISRCHCTRCGEKWYSGWFDGSVRIIAEYGETFPGVPGFESREAVIVDEGEKTNCPFCETEVTALRRSSMNNGRTYQLMVCEATSIERETVLLYSMLKRRLTPDGYMHEEAEPIYAVTLGPSFGLHLYARAKNQYYGRVSPGGDWQAVSFRDPQFAPRYYDYESYNHNCKNAEIVKPRGNFDGETAEKTGLFEYLRAGGRFPIQYLRFWKDHRSVENLMKDGLAKLVAEEIDDDCDRAFNYEWRSAGLCILGFVNFEKAKPHEMLFMSKEGYRFIKDRKWNLEKFELWYCAVCELRAFGPGDEREFDDYLSFFGEDNMERIIGEIEEGVVYDLAKLKSYLARQKRKHNIAAGAGVELIIDYHKMVCEALDLPLSELTEAQAWPGNLKQAHAAAIKLKAFAEKNKLAEEFERTARKWAALEWSDGEICAVLPKTNADLVEEGDTLDHCVGRYGADHVAGRLIIFIRHARRPERSWFTLNINTTKDEWREVQLHGYGNEWAHGKKLKIPKKVRDFCDKWEREVLTPVFKKVKAAEELAKKQDEKTDKKKKARKTA